MGKIYNWQSRTDLRQKLRNQRVRAEQLLWWRLQGSLVLGFKFRRQAGIGRYVADFYCPEVHLVIEVNGPSHYTMLAREYDATRRAYIESFGNTVLEFTNYEIYQKMDWAIAKIENWLKRRIGQSGQ